MCKGGTTPTITFTGSDATAPYTFTYTINGGSSQTITTTSGNSITVNAPTNASGSFVYSLSGVSASSTSTCINTTVSGVATVIVNSLPLITVNTNLTYGQQTTATANTSPQASNSWSFSPTPNLKMIDNGSSVDLKAIQVGGPTTLTYTDINGCFSSTSITVNAATLTVTANNLTKEYGLSYVNVVAGSPDFTTLGLLNGDIIGSVTLNIGPGSINPSDPVGSTPSNVVPSNALPLTGFNFDPNNYSINYVPGKLTVIPKPITLTVDAGQTKVYGTSDPSSYTYTVSPVITGLAVLSGFLTRTIGENVGIYAIIQNDLTTANNPNYIISYVGNIFEIKSPVSTLTIPNAFTPNNDGHNDKFMLFNNGYVQSNSFTFKVFNRAGQLLFKTIDINEGWDGRYNGLLQDTGAYIWVMDFVNVNGTTEHRSGQVLLLN